MYKYNLFPRKGNWKNRKRNVWEMTPKIKVARPIGKNIYFLNMHQIINSLKKNLLKIKKIIILC
jgi:hypothetical protein